MAAVETFLRSLEDDDYLRTFLVMSPRAQAIALGAPGRASAVGFANPTFDLTVTVAEDDPEFAPTHFNALVAMFAAIDRHDAWLVPRPAAPAITAVEAGMPDDDRPVVVDVVVDSTAGGPITFRTTPAISGRWRVDQIVGPGLPGGVQPRPDGVFVRTFPAEGTALCRGTIIVFDETSCADAGQSPEQARIDELTEQARSGEIEANLAAQEVQRLSIESPAPLVICQDLQTDASRLARTPDGEQIDSDLIASIADVCPLFDEPRITTVSYPMQVVETSAYARLDLATPEAAANTLLDAYARHDFWTVHLMMSPEGQLIVQRELQNLQLDGWIVDEAYADVVSLDRAEHSLTFVPLFAEWMKQASRTPGTLSLDLTGTAHVLGPGQPVVGFDATVSVVVEDVGTVTIGFVQAPSGRWQLRQTAAPGLSLDAEEATVVIWR